MKYNFFSLIMILCLATLVTSCEKDDATEEVIVTVDSSMPDGAFTADRSGSLMAENGTPTMGTVELGQDASNDDFLRFGSNFTTELATGTVSVYFSTSSVFTADPGNGNPDLILVGAIQGNGEQFFKLNEAIPSAFTHVILWCNTASIPFGNAELQ